MRCIVYYEKERRFSYRDILEEDIMVLHSLFPKSTIHLVQCNIGTLSLAFLLMLECKNMYITILSNICYLQNTIVAFIKRS